MRLKSKYIVFALFCLHLRAIFQVQAPGPGAYIWRGDLTYGFLSCRFGGLIHGGAYFWNFTVFSKAPIISQNFQGRFLRKVDNAIHCINLYQVESGFINRAKSIKGSRLDPF